MQITLIAAALTFLPAPADLEPLPLTGLLSASRPNTTAAHSYRAATESADCQAHFDHGLVHLYNRRWQEAAREFETATRDDPGSALAWWALSRALEGWGKDKHTDA